MSETPPIARSYLFVPGNRPERFDKACTAGADAVIVDLEDAVPADEKVRAREEVAAWLRPDRPVLLRINAADTPWHAGDLALCANPGVGGVVLPKAERTGDIRRLTGRLAADVPVLPLIETALGMWNACDLARVPGVRRLVFGSIDFRLDLGIGGDDDELLYFRSRLVLVSRVAELEPPVDGVTLALDDPAALRADLLRARRLGFGGKLCIHPKQVRPVHECLRPDAEEIAWARRVLGATEATGGKAVAVDGAMVDRPVIERARRILAEAEHGSG